MRMLAIPFKELSEIVAAVEFKLEAERRRNKDEMTEDESIDFGHDVAFLENLLHATKTALTNWYGLPKA